MNRLWLVAALVAASAAPSVAAAAQEPVVVPRVRRPGVGVRVEEPIFYRYEMFTTRRARLGVKVNLQAQDTDSIGAYIDAVTPGGPAAKAGIRSGDIITKVDGKSLLANDAIEADEDESIPGLRLIELAAKLEPNDTITVDFRRRGEPKSVSLVTGDEPNPVQLRTGPRGESWWSPGIEPAEEPMVEHLPEPDRFMIFGGPLADLELAPINPDLGRYFGVSEGILVISVPDDSRLNVKAGDVIQAVDGRKPSNPTHLLRILRSYDSGESFKLEIVRMKRKETVTGRLDTEVKDRRRGGT